jgi:hypothetical protein
VARTCPRGRSTSWRGWRGREGCCEPGRADARGRHRLEGPDGGAPDKANFNAVVFLAGLILLLFGFALGPDHDALRNVAGGVLWLTVLFSGVLSFNRSYEQELEHGALEMLLLYPGDRKSIFLGKLLANLTFVLLVEVVMVPAAALLYDLPSGRDAAAVGRAVPRHVRLRHARYLLRRHGQPAARAGGAAAAAALPDADPAAGRRGAGDGRHPGRRRS